MAEFKNTVGDAKGTMRIMSVHDGGAFVTRVCAASPRLRGGRALEANIGIALEAIDGLLKALDVHCRTTDEGVRVIGPMGAVSLSDRAQEVADACIALDLGMKAPTSRAPTTGPARWVVTRKLGRGGESADAQSAIQSALFAVAIPLARWNELNGAAPGAEHRRYRVGDDVLHEDLSQLRRALAALELALHDARRRRKLEELKPRKPRTPTELTAPQKECVERFDECGSITAVGRQMNRSPKTVRQHILAANRKLDGFAHVQPRRPRTQPLPKQL